MTYPVPFSFIFERLTAQNPYSQSSITPKKGYEKVLSSCSLNLPHFALVINIFLLPPVHRVDAKPSEIRD
jgi:hypothetical protein